MPKENVPTDADKSGLELYFLAEAEYQGKIDTTERWVDPEITFGMYTHSEGFDEDLGLPSDKMLDNYTVTYFKDSQFPVADKGDIFFTPTPENERWRPPYRVNMNLVISLLLTFSGPFGIVVFLVLAYLKIRRAKNPAQS